jgi:hypothetical protein
MDAMAMQLANQTTADAAWKAIFRTGKSSWAATKVAIKVNCIEPKNMASVAVLQKFCNIFTGFGVLPTNIFIYDGSSLGAAGIPTLAAYFSTTDTTKIQAVAGNNSILGGTTNATIPGETAAACTADIANGTIDILVNVANNKGHGMAFTGNATLCMKNHFGTFPPTHDTNYIFNINKSDAILGGTPVRQQLCFIDSLLANTNSNTGNPNAQPNFLIMGVFGPAVDYLTCKKVREGSAASGGMGLTNLNDTIIDQYITSFGYSTTDPVWVVVPPASAATCAGGGAGGAGGNSGAGGAGASGGTSGTAGARSGGTSGSGGVGNGGASGTGGVGSGGMNGSGGAGNGGASGSGGVGSGGASARSGGMSGTGGARSGGMNGTGGVGSGGATATGGTTGSGGAPSGGAGGTGGAATNVASASGGSATTGGNYAGAGTGASPTGGSAGASVTHGNSGSGCDVAGIDRGATRWGAMLAFGAVVAERLRRLVSGSDRSS